MKHHQFDNILTIVLPNKGTGHNKNILFVYINNNILLLFHKYFSPPHIVTLVAEGWN